MSLNTPISLLHFSFTLLEYDRIPKYYRKSHAHREMHFYCFKMQKTVAPREPSTILSPSHGRTSCGSQLHPWANKALHFGSDHWGTRIPRAECSLVSALLQPNFSKHLPHASKQRNNPEMFLIPYTTRDISSQNSFIRMCC